MAKAGLRKVVKTVRTKKGTVRRAYYVKAQGPQPKATLRSADASSGKAASRGRIIGAVLGSALGGTVGALGGAAVGGVSAHNTLRGHFSSGSSHYDAASERNHLNIMWAGLRTNDGKAVDPPSFTGARGSLGGDPYSNYMRHHAGNAARAYGGAAARGAMVFGTGGAASGAVVGALMGHVVGRAIDRRRARK